jgi:predicted lipoprotein
VRPFWTPPALAVLALSACVPAPPPTPDDPVADALLEQVGPGVVAPALDAVVAPFDALGSAAAAWATAPMDPARQAAVAEAWTPAFLAWQALEPLQIGPAGSSLTVPGGRDLRDRVYGWPVVDPCGVDRQVVLGEVSAEAVTGLLLDRTGLAALEALAFSRPGEHRCPFSVDIARDGTWDALGVEEQQARRATFAASLASDVVAQIATLRAAWSPDEAGWGATLASPGADNPAYASRDDAIDAVFGAMYYVERAVKDGKIGRPIGRVSCPTESCASEAESPFARASLPAIRVNLASIEATYLGAGGVGFDDLLLDRGHGDVDAAIQSALASARLAAEEAALPLQDAAGDPAADRLFDEVKAVADLFEGDLATVLTLAIPEEAAGDND